MMKTVHHKINKYRELATEIEKQWKMETNMLPIVITTNGIVPKATMDSIQKIGGGRREVRAAQKAVILHTTHAVRRVTGEDGTH